MNRKKKKREENVSDYDHTTRPELVQTFMRRGGKNNTCN